MSLSLCQQLGADQRILLPEAHPFGPLEPPLDVSIQFCLVREVVGNRCIDLSQGQVRHL